MRTTQKANNFNHGMIVPELAERSDLDLIGKSCASLINMFPMIYGGVRSRPGTKKMAPIIMSREEDMLGSPSSELGDVSRIQEPRKFQSNGIGMTRDLFMVDYNSVQKNTKFTIYGLKFNYRPPYLGIQKGQSNAAVINILDGGVGYDEKGPEILVGIPIKSLTLDAKGTLTAIDATGGNYPSAIFQFPQYLYRTAKPRNYKAGLYISKDNKDWTQAAEFWINEIAQTMSFNINDGFQYIKIALADTSSNIRTSFSLDYVNMKVNIYDNWAVPEYINLIDYYTNDEKFVIMLAEGIIIIYGADGLPQISFKNDYMTDAVIRTVKYAYQDDTIIFTHKDMQPHRLMRAKDNWIFGPYIMKNIPLYAFDGEVVSDGVGVITPSDVGGNITINITGGVFNANMVGQIIDGNGGLARITEYIYSPSQQLRARVIVEFYDKNPIKDWKLRAGYEPVWSEKRGWPRTCCFAQQRLVFGGSRDLPMTIWMTRIADYNNFLNLANYANDALDFRLQGRGEIRALLFNRGLQVFTKEKEYVIPIDAFTPASFRADDISSNGCMDTVQPIDFENAAIYVEKNGKSLFVNNDSPSGGGIFGSNLSMFADLPPGIRKIVLHKNSIKDKGNYIYAVMDSGEMIVISLNLEHNINALAKFKTNGKILSACVSENTVYMAVRRGINTNLEILTDDARLDCETITEVQDGRISSMLDFSQARVLVWQDGAPIWAQMDEMGNCDVKLPDGMANIGMPYDWELESNPISINGRSTSVMKSISTATVVCRDTDVMTMNGQTKRHLENYKFMAVTPYTADCRYKITGQYSPMTILSVQCEINYGG